MCKKNNKHIGYKSRINNVCGNLHFLMQQHGDNYLVHEKHGEHCAKCSDSLNIYYRCQCTIKNNFLIRQSVLRSQLYDKLLNWLSQYFRFHFKYWTFFLWCLVFVLKRFKVSIITQRKSNYPPLPH